MDPHSGPDLEGLGGAEKRGKGLAAPMKFLRKRAVRKDDYFRMWDRKPFAGPHMSPATCMWAGGLTPSP